MSHLRAGWSVLVLCALAHGGTPTTVNLTNGDRLTGEIVSEDDQHVVIEHPLVGTITIARGDIREDVGGDTSEPESRATHGYEAVASSSPNPDDEPPAEADPWTGKVGLAGTLSRAGSDTANIRINGELHRKKDLEQFDLTGTWYWNQSNGRTTDNDILVRASQDWFIADSRWLYFAQGTWQYDQFQDWGHRVSPYGGIGYRLVDTEKFSLVLKGGGGITWEYASRDVLPQLLFEAETSWTIDDRQAISGYASIAPEVTDFADYLFTAKIDYTLKLGRDLPWSLEAGVRNIYDSNPTGSSSANDLKAYLGIALDF